MLSPLKLDRIMDGPDNDAMRIPGHVSNGVVVLDGGATLPEGVAVTVSCEVEETNKPPRKKRRVILPLVKSQRPGSLHLTGEDIAKVFEEEDASRSGRFFKEPEP
jgi:hypothetical protein